MSPSMSIAKIFLERMADVLPNYYQYTSAITQHYDNAVIIRQRF